MIKTTIVLFLALFSLQLNALNTNKALKTNYLHNVNLANNGIETITFGGGCFWCLDALFKDLKGVTKVESGYAGGNVKNPSYKDVCSGTTGHAEVVQISFDPSIISLDDLLEVFWTIHDPTTLNRQGADIGTQYRSAIFYNNNNQKSIVENSRKNVASKLWDDPIVTQIVPLGVFYKAEDSHQDYYQQNKSQAYCQIVINPKLKKLKEKFGNKLK